MKILIVEDDRKIANALARGLKQENFITEVVYDGDDGLASILGDEYDLIILDWMLPGADGVEICQKARQADVKTPILFLTAKGQTRDKVAALDAGADDYLVKPFSFEELLARVRALLRRPNDFCSDVLVVGNLKLNSKTFVVARGNTPIDLSKTEFRLLEFLMRRPGQIVNKDTIISHVWDFDADILPNTVEAYIGYLRRKIDSPFKKKMIKTIRGFGYKIEA
ncbi:MAG: response regulator transcription factor [Candidatus Nanosyncoccaceae bacterium]|jgi:DNA-binding response OmpR family regulator